MEEQKRTKEIKIRLTEIEHKRLESIKTKSQLAVWIRELALNPTADFAIASPPKKIELAPETVRTLAGVSNNLNQIARRVNQVATRDIVDVTPIDAIEINLNIAEVKAILSEILNEVRRAK